MEYLFKFSITGIHIILIPFLEGLLSFKNVSVNVYAKVILLFGSL